ncbi:hypothetical protein FA13DRAFT_1709663 [Coprinellus micaceus]|uniref:Uncharacterized protein n=1 Tax=Coprinellus micaceus TaxID=71717 RepID=A0A4Y7TDW9_COPMI|nr:hypothetical protein FA13DRAFT_1709663 [Coprinellus micaceus]
MDGTPRIPQRHIRTSAARVQANNHPSAQLRMAMERFPPQTDIYVWHANGDGCDWYEGEVISLRERNGRGWSVIFVRWRPTRGDLQRLGDGIYEDRLQDVVSEEDYARRYPEEFLNASSELGRHLDFNVPSTSDDQASNGRSARRKKTYTTMTTGGKPPPKQPQKPRAP